ncbi:hypothetical protein D3C78_1467340 [compost metagenome]
MHTGRHLHMVNGKMVFGINHRTVPVGLQRTAVQLSITARQPQSGIDHMQIVVQQRKAHIVRADTVGAMLIHTQRRSAT